MKQAATRSRRARPRKASVDATGRASGAESERLDQTPGPSPARGTGGTCASGGEPVAGATARLLGKTLKVDYVPIDNLAPYESNPRTHSEDQVTKIAASILEFGWTSDNIHPSYAWHAVTEEQKADYMVRAYTYAKEHWRPWIALMSLIYIADSDWTDDREEAWWAITAPGYPTPNLRPAYYALRDMPKN
jgi:hypothetical protein